MHGWNKVFITGHAEGSRFRVLFVRWEIVIVLSGSPMDLHVWLSFFHFSSIALSSFIASFHFGRKRHYRVQSLDMQ